VRARVGISASCAVHSIRRNNISVASRAFNRLSLQMVWAWGVSLPVMFVNGETVDPPFGSAADVAGIVVFALSFLLEVAADLQKDAFRSNPANRGRVCDAGVWGYSRHPNFAGEIGMWWGLFILASPVFSAAASSGAAGSGWGYATILSPLLTFLILMCGSGMPTAEGDNQQRYMKTRRCVRSAGQLRRLAGHHCSLLGLLVLRFGRLQVARALASLSINLHVYLIPLTAPPCLSARPVLPVSGAALKRRTSPTATAPARCCRCRPSCTRACRCC
jgi:protein-S-isoprenylcysteine O-methyltransferase Ste14